MILSLGNPVFLPDQRISFVPKAEVCRLNCATSTCGRSSYRRNLIFFNFRGMLSQRCVVSASSFGSLWEDPYDGSDDSEYESDEDDEMEENDLDYESDCEENGTARANVDEPSVGEFDADLAKDVEQLLSPEERAILERNVAADLGKISTAKWMPLQAFALAGQIKFMDVLLAKGYCIDQADKDGITALHLATIGKREAVISHLLRKGADAEAKDKVGATPLHYAAQVGAMQTVKLLIKYKVDVNAADDEGWTPLHVAMQTRNRDMVKILVVNGADRMRKNKDGHTPLDLSLCYGKEFKSYDLAKLLKQVPVARDL